jgi:hypothetical protein
MIGCSRSGRLLKKYTYEYPAKSIAVKKTRLVAHTSDDPPNHGSKCLTVIGSIAKRRSALSPIATAYSMVGSLYLFFGLATLFIALEHKKGARESSF